MIKNCIIILLALFCIYLGVHWYQVIPPSSKVKTGEIKKLSAKMDSTRALIQSVAFTQKKQDAKISKCDTFKVISRPQFDTLKYSLNQAVKLQASLKDNQLLRDSIGVLKSNAQVAVAEIKKKEQALRNIVFTPAGKNAVLDSSNATVYTTQFAAKTHKNIFSPTRNYMRIFNVYHGGTVNNLPYWDIEQNNDDIKQLMFQVRVADNLSTGKLQFGAGAELKLNHFAVNAALFANPFAGKSPTVSLGLRQDLYVIKFK